MVSNNNFIPLKSPYHKIITFFQKEFRDKNVVLLYNKWRFFWDKYHKKNL